MGWGERSWRWCRRNPTAAALVVTALALVGLAVGGGFWLQRQQAERREETARQEGRQSQAAEAVLAQAADLQKQGRWPESRVVLEGAPSPAGQLGLGGPPRTRAPGEADARHGDRVGGNPAPPAGRQSHEPDASRGIELYAEAFRELRDCPAAPEPAQAAAQIRNSAIRETLLAFLHDWLFFWVSDADHDRLRAVLDRADDDDWRRRLRETLRGAYDPGKRQELLTGPGSSGPAAADPRRAGQAPDPRH